MESARHSVIANNLANVNTVGFRDDIAVVMAREAEAREDKNASAYATAMDMLGGGALVSETYTNHVQGPIQVTNKPLDLAIGSEGYFAVTDGQEVMYTRAGAFTKDTEGRLAMPDGKHFLSDASGRAMSLPLTGEIAIASDGTVNVDGATAAKIDLFTFSDEKSVAKIGANLYSAGGAKAIPEAGIRITQGALEMSTVNSASELTKMIMASRGYEMNMQMIRMQDQTLGDLISLGRVSF
jgi:flagellar basal body rod protein FlgG